MKQTLFRAVSLAAAFASSLAAPSVTVKNGTYTGVSVSSFKQELFLGMPFAQPPIPRLYAPKSLNSSWTGERKAEKYSPICIGYGYDDFGYETSEDCLTLNVVRPEGIKKGSDVPVMVWIYGGGFAMGGSADLRYNGTWIVEQSVQMNKPIIFASLNYRVDAYGFAYGKEIAAEGTGNFGLLDQRLALRWINENIASFGGDPSKVTIMGESAGAMSVSMQLLSEPSINLFRGGIMESGTATTAAYRTAAEYQSSFDNLVKLAGCSGNANVLDCVRNVDLATFVKATNGTGASWFPTIDGVFLKDRPTKLMKAGKIAKVNILLGANTDEGSSFGPRGIQNETALAAAVKRSRTTLSDASVAKMLEVYPDDPFYGCPFNSGDAYLSSGRQDKRSGAIAGDISMHAGRRLLAQTMAKYKPVYTYRFDQPPAGTTIDYGTTHFAEVAYVFSNPLPTVNPLPTRPGDAELANAMTRYWVNFVHDGNPNYSGAKLQWPNYQTNPSNVVFRRQGNFIEKDDYRKEGIAFINSLPSDETEN